MNLTLWPVIVTALINIIILIYRSHRLENIISKPTLSYICISVCRHTYLINYYYI